MGTFDTSAVNVLQECDGAMAHLKKYLHNHEDLRQVFVGSYYRSDMKPSRESPENYPFSFVANVKPKIVFDNPKVTAKSANVSVDSKQCTHTARAVNQWIRYTNMVDTLDPAATDFLLTWCVLLTEFKVLEEDEQLPEGQLQRMLPKTTIIENHRYFRDPVSTPAVKPRFEGHINVDDLEAIKLMKGVDPEAMNSIIADMDLVMLKRPNASSNTVGGNAGARESPNRREVVYYEVWIGECNDYRDPSQEAKLQNGTIFTIAIGQINAGGQAPRRVGKAQYLRKPRPFFGPKEGPYSLVGAYDVSGQTYPLSAVGVCMQQVEELNAHCTAAANAAARMKTLVFVATEQDTLQSAVQNSPDGSTVGVPGVTGDMIIPVVLPGPAKEQYEYIAMLRARLDRNIGQDDAQRGELQSGVTAFATNVAAQSSTIRIGELKRRFANGVKRVLQKVAWYAWESPNFIMFLSPDDATELGMKRPAFFGGPDTDPGATEHVPWDQAALDIDAYSMAKPDEGQLAQQTMETLAVVSQMAQEMVTAPWLGWKIILEKFSDVTKFDWLPEAINTDLFVAFQQQQQAQNEQLHAAQMATMQLQMEAMELDNQLKKMQIMQAMIELQGAGQGEAKKGPSVSMSYKDVPEDIKRKIELEAVGASSTMPMTAQSHVQNAVGIESQRATQQHKTDSQKADHSHKQGLSRTSALSGMLRDMARGKAAGGGPGAAQQGVRPLKKPAAASK